MHKHQCLAHLPADVQFFTILELYGHTRKGDTVIYIRSVRLIWIKMTSITEIGPSVQGMYKYIFFHSSRDSV